MSRDFARRHIGPRERDIQTMLQALGLDSLDELVQLILPPSLREPAPLALPEPLTEVEALAALRAYADRNQVHRSYLGMGYHDTVLPPVIQRNVLENPGWYTAYTPYQAEVAQGRLEVLVLFQQMIQDLTGLPVSNASLLDEATAAAEAMTLSRRGSRSTAQAYFVSEACHPQTIAVVQTRAEALGIEVIVGDHRTLEFDATPVFGLLLQYPDTYGTVHDYRSVTAAAHAHKALVTVAVDLLALTLLEEPAAFGADIAVGSTQRFGVPMGYGGPHAAFLATGKKLVRKMPGHIIGVSRDATGAPALRMALQTREQHIRREKATSNVCTAQVLPAILAALYAVWHGPVGLRDLAERLHAQASGLAAALSAAGLDVADGPWFDTLRVRAGAERAAILERAAAAHINLRALPDGDLCVALDETVTPTDLDALAAVLGAAAVTPAAGSLGAHARATPFLQHPAFSRYHSETEMMRYLHRLESRDLALNTAMIPLGSCTMKLNAATEMAAVSWEAFGRLHPFAPAEQAAGTRALVEELQDWLVAITGYDAVSMQPNSGAQGEYTGLMVIRAYHQHRGDTHRRVCLIPESAHGTNPASAVMAGMEVVVVRCDDGGDIDVEDLRAKAATAGDRLAALMVTYPSTHGVFEEAIREVCDIIHSYGGQVYMDGANLNAMLGLAKPGQIGGDVSHLNLHKTFAIPHGGGGPGMGPIAVRAHLAPFLPGHPVVATGGEHAIGPVSAAPFGSPLILPISWAFIAMSGEAGLRRSSQVAMLSANYLAHRLQEHYPVLFRGARGQVAHECILECRHLKAAAGIEVDDIAKRLMDYGFHAPTMSFPVAGTLMVEPTESEPLTELDRFVEAMVLIREEIQAVEDGSVDPADNVLCNAPHPARVVIADDWSHPYPREQAAYPTAATRRAKYWPHVARIDNVWGDRNLVTELPEDF